MFNNISPALKIAFLYLVLSFLWIIFSDSILNDLVNDEKLLSTLQTIKGTFFILITSIIIYILVNHFFKNEVELRKRGENVFNNAGVPLVLFNEDGVPLKINNLWLKLTGYSFEEINSFEKWAKRAFRDKADENMKIFKSYYNITKRVGIGEFKINTKDDRVLIWYIYLVPYGIIDGKKAFICTAIDLTEIKTQENLLIQQSKMAIMGEMLANITHQWKQPLSSINTSNSLLKLNREYGGFDDKIDDCIETIEFSVKNLAQTIDDFRDFLKPDKIGKYFKVIDCFDKVFKLMSSQFKNNEIEVIKDIKNGELYGFENELLQVLINIIKNSLDEFSKKDDDLKLIHIKSYQKNGNLFIEVKDNAGGIPNKVLGHIFDSYFTTKNDSEGTGIGLYMSKQIIEDSMKGKLTAYNEEFEYKDKKYNGAVFKITIPLDPISSIL